MSVLVFNGAGSPAKSSGWYFYPVTTTKAITFRHPENGTVAVTATNGTATPSEVASTGSVLVGTLVTVNLTPASGFILGTLTINGADVTASVATGAYQFVVNADAALAATFIVDPSTGVADTKSMNGVYPNPFKNSLKINNALNGSKIYLYDLNGKQALVSEKTSVNTAYLPKGTYMVKFTTASGVKTVKAVKE